MKIRFSRGSGGSSPFTGTNFIIIRNREITLHVVMVHRRIKPDDESNKAFLKHWREINTVGDRTGLITEFLSESLSAKEFPDTTWHLDPEATGALRLRRHLSP